MEQIESELNQILISFDKSDIEYAQDVKTMEVASEQILNLFKQALSKTKAVLLKQSRESIIEYKTENTRSENL